MKLNKPKVQMKRKDIKQLENIVAHLFWYKSQYDGRYDCKNKIYGNDDPSELRKAVQDVLQPIA